MNAGLKPMQLPQHVVTIYRAIKHAASMGESCPTNEELRERANVGSNSTIARGVALLEKLGLIVVHRYHMARQVDVLELGKSTAKPMTEILCRPSSRRASEAIGQFCDSLSDGSTIAQAAILSGISESAGKRLFAKIKSELGWQAQ